MPLILILIFFVIQFHAVVQFSRVIRRRVEHKYVVTSVNSTIVLLKKWCFSQCRTLILIGALVGIIGCNQITIPGSCLANEYLVEERALDASTWWQKNQALDKRTKYNKLSITIFFVAVETLKDLLYKSRSAIITKFFIMLFTNDITISIK